MKTIGPHQNQVRAEPSADSRPPCEPSWIISRRLWYVRPHPHTFPLSHGHPLSLPMCSEEGVLLVCQTRMGVIWGWAITK